MFGDNNAERQTQQNVRKAKKSSVSPRFLSTLFSCFHTSQRFLLLGTFSNDSSEKSHFWFTLYFPVSRNTHEVVLQPYLLEFGARCRGKKSKQICLDVKCSMYFYLYFIGLLVKRITLKNTSPVWLVIKKSSMLLLPFSERGSLEGKIWRKKCAVF